MKMERQLPNWMLNKRQKADKDGKEPSTVETIVSTDSPVQMVHVHERRLAYIMSPNELELVARSILGLK